MVTAIKKQIQITWTDWILTVLVILGSGIFGKLLFHIVAYFDDEMTAYFPLAAMLAAIVALVFAVLMTAVQMPLCFNLEISMGNTRKHFFVSFFATTFVGSIIEVLLVAGIGALENAMNAAMYPTWETELDLLPYILKWGLLVCVFANVIGALCGNLVMRFGKVALWILWVLWMFLCIGVPQIQEAVEEAPDSLYGRIGVAVGGFVSGIPVNIWIAAGIAAGAVAFIGSWLMLRRQQVTG